MNVLAHLTLAGPDPALRAGGFLGDFVKGPVAAPWNGDLAAGIKLHRYIDARSNENPDLRASANALEGFPRRFAPPFIDLLADFFLAREFPAWHGEALATFSTTALHDLGRYRAQFPESARRFLDRIDEIRLLEAYAEETTMTRVAGRLLERLGLSMDLRDAFRSALGDPQGTHRETFERYYPTLMTQAERWRTERHYA